MTYKSNSTLAQENYILRKQLSYQKARVTILTLERDAARVALTNYNMKAAYENIESKYKGIP